MIPNPERAKGGGPQLGASVPGEPGPFGTYGSDDDGQEPDDVDPVAARVRQQIAAAQARRDRQRAQRQALDRARQYGLAARHAAKLRHLAQRDEQPPDDAA